MAAGHAVNEMNQPHFNAESRVWGAKSPSRCRKDKNGEFLSCTADLAPEKVQKLLLSAASTDGKMNDEIRFFASICLFGLRTEIDTSVVLLSAESDTTTDLVFPRLISQLTKSVP